MLAKSSGYVEFSVPSLSEMRSDCYGGGKTSTLKMQWKRPGETSWHDGETVTFDQRVFTVDFVAYGIPQTAEPIVVRLNSIGSNDVYLTDLTLNGFNESVTTAIATTPDASASGHIQLTANGIIVYGDVAAITVYNANGQLVAQSALSQFCNLATLGKGIYVVKAQMKNGTSVNTKVLRR
jgi:hypothetical protein